MMPKEKITFTNVEGKEMEIIRKQLAGTSITDSEEDEVGTYQILQGGCVLKDQLLSATCVKIECKIADCEREVAKAAGTIF